MQTPLPSEYTDFIGKYGTGNICEFLTVLSPAAANPHMNLTARGAMLLRSLRECRTTVGQDRSIPVFPERGGLLPWGVTDNGDVCYWRTQSPNPDLWPIVVNDGRGSMWEEFPGTMTEFLHALLSCEFESDILTDEDFPPAEPYFSPA